MFQNYNNPFIHLRNLLNKIANAIYDFKISFLQSIIITVIFSFKTISQNNLILYHHNAIKIGLVCIGVLILNVLIENMKIDKKWTWSKSTGLFAINIIFNYLAYRNFKYPILEITYYNIIYIISLYLLFIILFLLYFFASDEKKGWYRYFNFQKKLITSFLQSSVLLISSIGILYIIKIYYNLTISLFWYYELIVISYGLVFPIILFIYQNSNANIVNQIYPQKLRLLVGYILFPLFIVSSFVVFIYSYKLLFFNILVTNMAGYLLILYLIFGFIIYWYLYPIKHLDSNFFWIKYYEKYLFLILLVICPIIIYSTNRTISQQGITEPRFIQIILALVGIVLAVFKLLNKSITINQILLTLISFLILSLWGPLNMSRISNKSQESKLIHLLSKYEIIQNNTLNLQIDSNLKIHSEDLISIKSKFNYLKLKQYHPQLESIFKISTESINSFHHDLRAIPLINYLLTKNDPHINQIIIFRMDLLNEKCDIFPIDNFKKFSYIKKNYVTQLDLMSKMDEEFTDTSEISNTEIRLQNDELKDYKLDLTPVLSQLFSIYHISNQNTPNQENLIFNITNSKLLTYNLKLYNSDTITCKLIISELQISKTGQKYSLDDINGLLFY